MTYYRHRRTSNPATAFPSPIEPGEIAANTANRQLAIGDADAASLGTPVPLIAIRYFDARASYKINEWVVVNNNLYLSKGNVAPGSFNPAQWQLAPNDLTKLVLKDGDTVSGAIRTTRTPFALADEFVSKQYVDAGDALPATSIADGIVTFAKMAATALATAAEYLSATANKILTADGVWAAAVPVALADAATVTPNFGAGIDFYWTLGAAGRTLANPINGKRGQKGIIYLIQDATGGRTITTWGSAYKFSGGAKPTLSTTGGAWDMLSYAVGNNPATQVNCTFIGDVR
jgi:hypothetical protein